MPSLVGMGVHRGLSCHFLVFPINGGLCVLVKKDMISDAHPCEPGLAFAALELRLTRRDVPLLRRFSTRFP